MNAIREAARTLSQASRKRPPHVMDVERSLRKELPPSTRMPVTAMEAVQIGRLLSNLHRLQKQPTWHGPASMAAREEIYGALARLGFDPMELKRKL